MSSKDAVEATANEPPTAEESRISNQRDPAHVRRQNRRLRFMQTVLKSTDGDGASGYFSRAQIAQREPILVEELWGTGASSASIAELLDLMEQKFLHGEDREFVYELVDEDERLDDRQQEERDIEERYFDAGDDVEDAVGAQCTDTGVQDF